MILAYKFRIKDQGKRGWLTARARAVNTIWNYCNETALTALRKEGKWLSGLDLNKLTSGVSSDLGLAAQSVQQVCKQYAKSRYQFKKAKLAWRSSFGGRKSLGWVPCTNQSVKVEGSTFTFMKKEFKFWKSRPLEGRLLSASMNEDSRGRWYVNFVCEVPDLPSTGTLELGVDLGLKTQVTLSDGRKFDRPNLTKVYAKVLAKAQRAGKKAQVSNIHAKIKNSRKDWSHKTANAVLKDAGLVVVGDVNSSKLMKGLMAKSVSDAAWGDIKLCLDYKSRRLGTKLMVVNESWTSRTCHVCWNIGTHQGLSGLSVREWTCSSCGACHDRDVNAALNILRLGHETLFKGVSHAV